MKILALDASTTAIGWAVFDSFDLDRGHMEALLSYGVEKLNGDLWERLHNGREWLLGKFGVERVHLVALETPVVYRNAKATIKQAYMVGVLGSFVLGAGIRPMEIRPDERLTALGLPPKMRDPKPHVVRIVNQIYSLDLDPKKDHDIADAIAIGWAVRRRLASEHER